MIIFIFHLFKFIMRIIDLLLTATLIFPLTLIGSLVLQNKSMYTRKRRKIPNLVSSDLLTFFYMFASFLVWLLANLNRTSFRNLSFSVQLFHKTNICKEHD